MKTNTPIAFAFESNAVRIVSDDSTPWFVATDVCEILGISNTTQALQSLDDDERSMFNIGRSKAHGGGGEVNIVNESGLYALILRSRKPEAKRFRKWVTSEILPAIRKSGGYGVLSPADEIRYLNQRLALLDRFGQITDPVRRGELYAQYKVVSERLGFEVPPLEAFAPPHPHDALDSATRRTLESFWQAVEALQNLAIPVNHHRDPRYIAINLKEIIQLAEDNGIAIPGRIELKRALPACREPAFIAASHTVYSRHSVSNSGRPATPRCYIFHKPV